MRILSYILPFWALLAMLPWVATGPIFGADCNGNGTEDSLDVNGGGSDDCNANGIPDECEETIFRLGRIGAAIELLNTPKLLVKADLDGDGDLDLATGDAGDSEGGIRVFVNEEGENVGKFSGPEILHVGWSLHAMAAGDVDGDGDVDLAAMGKAITATGTTFWITVFFNEGSGAFSDPLNIENPGGDTQDRMRAADINGDGNQDLVVTKEDIDEVDILLGRSEGSLAPAQNFSIGQSPRDLAISDLDNDGDLDIVTVNWTDREMSILLNEGGTEAPLNFAPVLNHPLQGKPRVIAAADFNDDRLADFVVGSKSGIFILLNEGDGRSFASAVFPQSSTILGVADFDGDGDVDIASNYVDSENVSVLLNDGVGNFDSKLDFGMGTPMRTFVHGDFDSDRDVDVVGITHRGPVTLAFLWNGEGKEISVTSKTVPMINGRLPHTAVLADLDGDGDLDLATGNGDQQTLTILTNDGLGEFTPLSDDPSGEYDQSMAAGDFDRDGDVDLVLVNQKSPVLRVFYNRGDAVFPEKREFRIQHRAFFITTADLNDDGFLDLIVASESGGSVSFVLNDGAGTGDFIDLPDHTQIRVGAGTRSITHGDFDGDGDTDLATANAASGTVAILYNNGDATFAEPQILSARGDPFAIAAGDWNRDGHLDLAIANYTERRVGVLTNRGDGRFELTQFVGTATSPYSMVAADFNGDGYEEVITTNEGSGNVTVLLNNRDGTLFLLSQIETDSGPRFSPVGDVDGDGDVDIVAANRAARTYTVVLNDSSDEDETSFEEHICTLKDFEALAVKTAENGLGLKYILPAREGADLLPTLFQNTRQFNLHQEFLQAVFPDRFAGLTADQLIAMTTLRTSRKYFIGAVDRIPTDEGYRFIYSVVTAPSREEVLTLEEVRRIHSIMSQAFELGPLSYAPDPTGLDPLAREAAQDWDAPEFDIFLGRVSVDSDYVPYTRGVGHGRVRIFNHESFEEANARGLFTFQDIAVIDHAPRDIEGVIGGVITAEPQGSLSHVSIRTARRGTPNAFVASALSVFAPYEGMLVRLEVQEGEFLIEEATQEAAEEFWSRRPKLDDLPAVDESYRSLDRFEEMDLVVAGGVPPEARYGGKASGLARLQSILTGAFAEYREPGFAIPVAYYLEFMRNNFHESPVDGRRVTYETYLEELFRTPRFQTDSTFRANALEQFRDLARDEGSVSDELVSSLAGRIEEVFGSPDVMVRFRSSSNVEDLLEFNGAGLYESTSVCVADSFDGDQSGPSRCDQEQDSERTIRRALKKVWTSLWTFRAHEERSFFQIPQTHVAMGVLVNRVFRNEAANGVAFTGDPLNPRGGCYLVTVQVDEESVVSPEPGVLPEVDVVEVVEGRVVGVQRTLASTLVGAGEFVLSDGELEELGVLMGHIDRSYPLKTDGHPREDVLLDMEFKLEQDGALAVKQIRPFLISGSRREWPTFALEIPPGTTVCGVPNLNSPSGSPETEYAAKSTLRFRAGTFELPASHCAFSVDLVEEVFVGPARTRATPDGPGVLRVEQGSLLPGDRDTHTFTYKQSFSISDGSIFEVNLFNLQFRADGPTPVEKTLVLDAEFITFQLSMRGFVDVPSLFITYSSCDYALLPAWDVNFELEGEVSFQLRERFLPPEDLNATGPAAIEVAEIVIGNVTRRVTSYWNLVYSAGRHNAGVTYRIILDPPINVPGVEASVHAVELDAADPPEFAEIVAFPQKAAVAYLDENFQVLARPEVLSHEKDLILQVEPRFIRGDGNVDGSVDVSDVTRLLEYLFGTGDKLFCEKAADANDDGRINLSDGVSTVLYLFHGKILSPPSQLCGPDPTTDQLPCQAFPICF